MRPLEMDGGVPLPERPRFQMAVSRILSGPVTRAAEPVRPFVLPRALLGGTALADCDYYPEASNPLARFGTGRQPKRSCSVLHRMGFFVPPSLRRGRWALTPPFHPYRRTCVRWRFIFCDTFRQHGLSSGPPARSTRHAALRCPDFPLRTNLAVHAERPSAISCEPSSPPSAAQGQTC